MKRLLLTAVFSTTGLLTYSQTGQNTQTISMPVPKNFVLSSTEIFFSLHPMSPRMRPYEISVHQNGEAYFRWLGEPDGEFQPIRVSEKAVKTLDAAYDSVQQSHCEAKERNIAQTGKKSLSFSTGPAVSSCDFNYSDHEDINAAASTFIAIAETVQIGEKLSRLHRFDRLGLDPEMKSLVDEVKDGRAIEVQNIAPTLQSLIDDDRVLERVRRQAATLLEQSATARSPQK